jgi:hypothetical protein
VFASVERNWNPVWTPGRACSCQLDSGSNGALDGDGESVVDGDGIGIACCSVRVGDDGMVSGGQLVPKRGFMIIGGSWKEL